MTQTYCRHEVENRSQCGNMTHYRVITSVLYPAYEPTHRRQWVTGLADDQGHSNVAATEPMPYFLQPLDQFIEHYRHTPDR